MSDAIITYEYDEYCQQWYVFNVIRKTGSYSASNGFLLSCDPPMPDVGHDEFSFMGPLDFSDKCVECIEWIKGNTAREKNHP